MSNLETIKKLRDLSGAGMVDCQKALKEADDDVSKAIEILRKKGIAKAAKREGREAGEGLIVLVTNEDNTEGYMAEVNAETDFVVRNEKFQDFVNELLTLIKDKKPGDLGELMRLPMRERTVKETLDSLSGTIGEKMEIKNFAVLKSSGTVYGYSHMGGKIGVLVALDRKEKEDLAHDIAMQVAALGPRFINPEDVPKSEITKEKEIYREQLFKEGKPAEIIDKILIGKINKYYEEVCLLKQEFIKEDKKKVEDILDGIKVENFIRYSLQ